ISISFGICTSAPARVRRRRRISEAISSSRYSRMWNFAMKWPGDLAHSKSRRCRPEQVLQASQSSPVLWGEGLWFAMQLITWVLHPPSLHERFLPSVVFEQFRRIGLAVGDRFFYCFHRKVIVRCNFFWRPRLFASVPTVNRSSRNPGSLHEELPVRGFGVGG